MRRQTPYACLCIVALLAACVGARFTYQDLSVPKDGIQGFSITQSFDDNEYFDENESSATNWDDAFGRQMPSSGMTDASFSVSRLVDSLYDAFFSPHIRTMEYMMPPDAVAMPYPRYASGANDAWSASYPSDVQIVDSVSPSDLFRQLSLARFAPQRYRVYVVPVAEDSFDGEPSMEDLLRELDEEADFLSSQLDDFTLEEDLQDPDSLVVTHYAADDPITPSANVSYDAMAMPEPGYDDMVINSYSGYEYDPLNYEYEPDADVYYYSAADAYGDSGYDDVYDLALDPSEARRANAEDLMATYATAADPFADSEPYDVGHQLPANPHKPYEVFDELPNTGAGSDGDPMYERGCHGFWSHFKTDGFSVWTAVLCAACVGMWVYVFVEYRCNSWASRPAFARSSDDGSDSLGSPSESGTKAPLLPLKGEYDGVESADVFLAYSKDYWLKVQHARDHAMAEKSDYTLKAFAQP